MINLDEWEERAAIMEFDGGLTRFRAETEAARRQGYRRWEVRDARCKRDTGTTRDSRATDERDHEDNLSGLQRRPTEEDGQMSFGDGAVGRSGLVLPPLRVPGR